MTEEPYWGMYINSLESHPFRRYEITQAPDHIKKILKRKHLWVVRKAFPPYPDLNYFPSREKAARFWVLMR